VCVITDFYDFHIFSVQNIAFFVEYSTIFAVNSPKLPTIIPKLFLPLYATEAGGEFGAVLFVVSNTGTTDSVTGTVFRTGTIDIIMWTMVHEAIPET
jgi:hypothetical protein